MFRRLAALTAILVMGMIAIAPAQADLPHPGVVSTNPVDWTPHVLEGTVYAFAVVGQTVVVGGDFRRVQDVDGTTYNRSNIFAFALGTGKVLRNFAPSTDKPVRALAVGGNGSVFVGGEFTYVNGQPRRGIVQLDKNGAMVGSFPTTLNNGIVRTLATWGNHVYVGGEFTKIGGVRRPALARLNAANGAVDPNFDMGLSRWDSGRLWVQSLAITPNGSLLAFDGTFDEVQGFDRYQVALAHVGGNGTAMVSKWSTDVYAETDCDPRYETYLRDLDFSPDGSYFVLVTTGHDAGPHLMCNTAAKFSTAARGDQQPVWINHTGGNTLWSVAVTGTAVYVGGHQQWLDNPEGDKFAGEGAVYRPGIGAIDPKTGKALSWNPTKDRGVGTEAIVAYPGGLLVGSDTTKLGKEYHARVGIFPLS